MAGWGELWGKCALWGVGECQDDICALADERVLVQIDDTTGNRKFRDMICDLVSGLGHYIDTMKDVGLSFDLATAVGDQLDKIGSVVGLPRQGFDDARYRTFLEIQTELLLAQRRGEAEWTGTAENILRICRTFVGGAAPPITITNLPPYSYTLNVPTLPAAEAEILARFICIATYAGVLGNILFGGGTEQNWDSETAGPAIPNTGNWDSESVGPAIPTPLIWGFIIQIGAGGDC